MSQNLDVLHRSLDPGTPTGSQAGPSGAAGPRLLVIVRGGESYGTATKMLGVMEALVERGIAPGMYVLGDGALVETVRKTLPIEITMDPSVPPRFEAESGRLVGYLRTVRSSIPFMRNLAAYLKRTPWDAVIFCEHGLALQVGIVAHRAGAQAFWLMANGVTEQYPLDLNRRLYAFAFRNLAVVPVANSEYTRQTLGRGARYASKIDLGVNPDRVGAPASQSTRLPGPVRLLVMARLVPGKGHLVLLRAMLSSPAFDEIQLVACGGPLGTPYAEELMREAAAHDAGHRLHLAGPVSDLGAEYAKADVVVNARLDPEPFGLSVVEAMMAGKPVLAHASGGPADIVLDGVTGWHVAAPTVAAFASGLSRMLADRAKWPEMAAAARARALAHYTHHTMTGQLLAIVAERLGRP